jgi:hypothetical protein
MSGLPPSALPDIPGGAELIDWFGFTPHFHDANVLSVAFAKDGRGEIRIHAWRMTDQTDDRGYFILDKHAVVTLSLEGIREINLGIVHDLGGIHDLSLSATKDGFRIDWENSCGTGGPGIDGSTHARRVSVSFVPGEPVKSGAS